MATPQTTSVSHKLSKTAIINTRVFDGTKIGEPSTVIIENGLISASTDTKGARVVDARGATLLPGLIDAHVHIYQRNELELLRNSGVTTALDMGTPMKLIQPLRALANDGLTDLRCSSIAVTAPGSIHSQMLPPEAALKGPGEAAQFVKDRIAEGSDYIKIIADVPGPDQALINAVVAAARQQGKLTIAHTAKFVPFNMALEGKVDMVTHTPLDKPVETAGIERMRADGRIAIPTLAMMEKMKWPGASYEHARATVTAMHKAGVPILAGTDANGAPKSPAPIEHGKSLHRELELLVDAGLTNVEALQAATSLPAQYFGLKDRGSIKAGLRADLVLVGGNPIGKIAATQLIQKVWCGGVEYERK